MKHILLPNQSVQASALPAGSKDPFAYIRSHTSDSFMEPMERFKDNRFLFENPPGLEDYFDGYYPELGTLANGMKLTDGALEVPEDGVYFVAAEALRSHHPQEHPYGARLKLDAQGQYDYQVYCTTPRSLALYATVTPDTRVEYGFRLADDGRGVLNLTNDSHGGDEDYIEVFCSGHVEEKASSSNSYFEAYIQPSESLVGNNPSSSVFFTDNGLSGATGYWSFSTRFPCRLYPGTLFELMLVEHTDGSAREVTVTGLEFEIVKVRPYTHSMGVDIGYTLNGAPLDWFTNFLSSGDFSYANEGLSVSGAVPLRAGMRVTSNYSYDSPFNGSDYRKPGGAASSMFVQKVSELDRWDLWEFYEQFA